MEIKLDDVHYLVSDKYSCWLETECKSEKGKVYRRRISGYTACFEDAVTSYIKERINSSEATKITKLANEIKELKKEVRGWHETYNGKSAG